MGDLTSDLLTALEHDELRLLTWGYVDGGFTYEEVVNRVDEELVRRGDFESDPAAVVSEMLASRLLIEVATSRGPVLRSRMAETVRLLARLRQLFPSHGNEAWRAAATLVSDFRILARPRSFPKQDVRPVDALDELASAGLLEGHRRPAAEALLSGRGAQFCLSRFQVDTAAAVLGGLTTGVHDGTMVCAGTGSGKTLAFYLPALAHLAASVTADKQTRVLALYPRIELLRDQVGAALRELNALRRASPRRPLRIGVLYGSTPWTPDGVNSKYTRWERAGAGHVCPYTRCPFCTDGELIWSEADRTADRDRLVCSLCAETIEDILLTRERLLSEAPDVLFTTTEMLNRALLDPRLRRLVGLDGRGVDLVLLDEVHTYTGTHGAHVASLLRRWRAAHAPAVHLIGLSATLAEARDFFGALTGLRADRIGFVEPRREDMKTHGQEYLIALRADPISGAGVLSASIQTAMLLARSLDRPADPISDGVFGQRVFAFTDDLDVTNRLYFDLLDAEGRGARNITLSGKAPLASLRAPTGDDLPGRRDAGQVWDLADRLGWPLSDGESSRLRVGRTSSQDAGVERDAEVVVATASLEVGFDDDRVGAVLQHKSPHDDAAFMQRRGRAGRTRIMRPWTAIVLSDFGRDRITYLAYERLFDPQLAPRALPTGNPIVLRMQAVLATLEWLGQRHRLGMWSLLTAPGAEDGPDARRRATVAATLESVLEDPATRATLSAHLRRALDVDDDTVRQLLWEPPRPLLTTVVPTALRRLQSNWRTADGGRDRVGAGPLPEFVVSRLFADLELPEAVVQTPSGDEHPLRIVQALRAYAPGRVSHRLTIRRRRDRHWIAPPELRPGELVALEISGSYLDAEELGMFRSSPAEPPVRCIRPGRIAVVAPPEEIRSASNGSLLWESELVSLDDAGAMAIEMDERLAAHDLIARVQVLTHGQRAPIETRRWARTVQVALNTAGQETLGRVQLTDGGDAVGVGFATEVDGLGLQLQPPVSAPPGDLPADLERSLRSDRFREAVMNAPEFTDQLSIFARARIVDGYLAALADAGDDGVDASAAHARLNAEGLAPILARAQAALPVTAGPTGAAGSQTQASVNSSVTADVVARAAVSLWEPIGAGWHAWIDDRTRATVGAAVHRALQALCPEYDLDDVNIDLRRRSAYGDPQDLMLWLSESTPGGGGPLQEAARRVAERPWIFSDLVVDALEPSDAELVDSELRRTARLAVSEADVTDALRDVRAAVTHAGRTDAFERLRVTLAEHGVFVCHPVLAAISTRLLRPGASAATDHVLSDMLAQWDRVEEDLGIEVPVATFAWRAAREDAYDRAALIMPPSGTDARVWRAAQLTGLLWPRGGEARRTGLRAPNLFHDLPATDRLLARRHLRRRTRAVAVEACADALAPDGVLSVNAVADITAAPDQARELRNALLAAAAAKVESGAVLVSPAVTAVRRTGDMIAARLTVQELV
jgi:hypothetical protein